MRLAHLGAAGAIVASLAAAWGWAAAESPARPAQATLSIGDAQAAEGNAGSRALSFRVTLSEVSRDPVAVSYRTQDETARAPEDYERAQGSLQFSPGETSKTVQVPIKGDRKVEPDEFFSVVLFAPTGATVAEPGGVGTGAIQNDDQPAVLPPPVKAACTCKRMQLRLAGFNHGATSLTGVVKATMTCASGDIADCAGFVKTVSPLVMLKPRQPFTCRAKKCSSTNTYALQFRIRLTRYEIVVLRNARRPLKKTLRLRAGCRGRRGQLRTFKLVFPSK
jgi:hypothetical protein